MPDKTKIEWTDATWNPIRGCSRVSDGCSHCYAQGVANRFSGPGQAYEGLVHIGKDGKALGWNGQIRFVEKHLLDPLKWKKPRRIFVNSMSDLFHEEVTDEMRDRIFAVMALSPQHTFQVLTKRPDLMLAYSGRLQEAADQWSSQIAKPFTSCDVLNLRWMHWRCGQGPAFPYGPWPLPNVWLGVSVENQQAADERIPLLLQTPAAVRFLSCEPLLGPVNLTKVPIAGTPEPRYLNALQGVRYSPKHSELYTGCDDAFTRWVIAGGESGRGARPMHPDWARSLRDQCAHAGVPFFFKQWGEWAPREMCTYEQDQSCDNGEFHAVTSSMGHGFIPGCFCSEGDRRGDMRRVGKRAAGHLLDGVEHHAFPEVGA